MKKLILIFVFFISVITLQAQVLIGVGTVANDGTGDPLRTAFQKHNTNVTAIYDSLSHIYTETQVTNFLNLHLDIDDTASMLGKYARKLSPTFTGTVTLPTATSIGSVSATEISYVNNVTSAIQTQIDTKLAKADSSSTAGKKYATGLMLTTGLNLKVNISDTASMLGPYINRTDTATMLSTYINHVDTAGMLTPYINRADTASMLTPYINRADTAAMLDPYIKEGDTLSISSIAPLLVDTIPLATFGAGTGLIADTALFNNGVLIGSFYNEGSDTLVITQLMGVMKEGTGTETISVQFSWHATFLSGSATSLNAAALAITSLTTGTSDVSFANAKIPPNVFVWGILSGASKDNKPTFLSVTLSGYKIPGY